MPGLVYKQSQALVIKRFCVEGEVQVKTSLFTCKPGQFTFAVCSLKTTNHYTVGVGIFLFCYLKVKSALSFHVSLGASSKNTKN